MRFFMVASCQYWPILACEICRYLLVSLVKAAWAGLFANYLVCVPAGLLQVVCDLHRGRIIPCCSIFPGTVSNIVSAIVGDRKRLEPPNPVCHSRCSSRVVAALYNYLILQHFLHNILRKQPLSYSSSIFSFSNVAIFGV
ncbi:hypothetical protein F4808DRAFT_210069 [Astrocystis sublimbata]|nr:hypothetical protein F4808DRAFT_210069 [Astrocystis sublimbata]